MKIIDLTMMIDEQTPVFPGDPKQEIKQAATIEKNGWNEKRISFNSHFSTHIDAPFHMLKEGKKLTDYPIDRFIGNCVIINVRNDQEINYDSEINLDNIKQNNLNPSLEKLKQDDIVFFCTGHTKKAGSKEFFENNPAISKSLAQKLVDKKVKIIGLDSFSPDNAPFEIHKLLFKHDILIVENLVNLDKLAGKRFKCYILPLKIKDADGAPCRVIGIVNE